MNPISGIESTAWVPSRVARLDRIGIGLALAFAGWVWVAGFVSGGWPLPMSLLGFVVVLTVIVGDRLTRVHSHLVPILVAASPLVSMIIHRSSPSGGDVVGYANASGALFLVAASGAAMLGSSSRGAVPRTIAYLVAVTWIFVPWNLQSHAAGALGAVLLLSLALSPTLGKRGTRRVLLCGAAASIAGLLATAGLGVAGYRPSQGVNLIDHWFQQTIDEARVVLWGHALDMIREFPVTGVGPGTFSRYLPTGSVPDDLFRAHNEYLQVAAETGIPGAALLLSLVTWAFVRLWIVSTPSWSLPPIVALAGVSLHANIDYIWHYAEVPFFLGLLVGAGSVAPDIREVHEPRPIFGSVRAVTLSSVLLWLALLAPVEAWNPAATAENGADWSSEEPGLRFTAPGLVRSVEPPGEILARIVESGAFAIEVRAASNVLDQEGPARILSISDGIADRNFTLGQAGNSLVFRLRTTETSANGVPQLEIPKVFTSTDVRHIVVVRDSLGVEVYVDGTLRWAGPYARGSLETWARGFPLLLGNESSGDRPWIGEIESVALYDRRLNQPDVQSRYRNTVAAPASLDSPESSLIALYRFDGTEDRRISDRSPRGVGPDLTIPERIPARERGPTDAFLDAGGNPFARLASHAVFFGLWGTAVVTALRRRFPSRDSWRILVYGTATICAAVTVLRYLGGRSPSPWDVVGAAIGCGIGLIWIAFRGRELPE